MEKVSGGDVWVVAHDLAVVGHSEANLRPINYLTFLAQVLTKGDKGRAYRLGVALESKLAAVRFFHKGLRGVVAEAGEAAAPSGYVQDYRDTDRIVSVLEAFLNAVYSSLEVSAKLNVRFHRGLPWNFRDQSRVFSPFSMDGRPWLARFLDLRSELAHFGSPLPIIKERRLVVEFTIEPLLTFSKGLQEIEFNEIGRFAYGLFELLDSWALGELASLDPQLQVDVMVERAPRQRPKFEKRRAADLVHVLGLQTGSNGDQGSGTQAE